MSVERFDQIARLLAQGTPRRQIIKGFAAGLGASLFSTFGFAHVPGHQQIAHAAPLADESYLPFILVDKPLNICSVASTCDAKVNCSTSEDCRCIESAEGDIRCGAVPTCSAQSCTSSADCANLGADYFCDSIGSGCCDEQYQRCIAPCGAVDECTEDRICGEGCCPTGYICHNGSCVLPVDGTWTGTLSHEGQSIGIRIILTTEGRVIAGRVLFQDPISKLYLETGEVHGDYDPAGSNLTLDTASYAYGNFEGNSFTGEFIFEPYNDEEGIIATLAMQRD